MVLLTDLVLFSMYSPHFVKVEGYIPRALGFHPIVVGDISYYITVKSYWIRLDIYAKK